MNIQYKHQLEHHEMTMENFSSMKNQPLLTTDDAHMKRLINKKKKTGVIIYLFLCLAIITYCFAVAPWIWIFQMSDI